MKKNKRRKSRSREFKKNSDIIDIEEARAQRKAKREKQEKQTAKKRLEENRGNLSARRRAKQKRFRAVCIAVMLVVSGMLVYSIFNIVSLKMEERSVIEKNEKLLKKKAELQKKLKKIKDSKYVENQAREQLKLIMPGETLYVFPEDDDDSGNSR